ncbi:MAG: peptidase M50, partial [Gammaproteobacteria bacterium]|nr:peptidase M50 [Gammaproteobacteria bacterium]
MHKPPTDPLFERLQDLRPQLAAHIRLLPQDYRGERWFVLADEAQGRYMRFNTRAYAALGRFNGSSKLSDLFVLINANEHTLTQQELAGLVLQLDNLNALHEALPEDVQAMTGNAGKTSRGQNFNPLAMRFRLFDPDQFLEVAMPWVQPLFSKTAAAFWCVTVVFAALLGITHVTEIEAALNSSLLAPENLLLGWLVFTVMKVIHEFAHAFSVKLWGGEVHEMGISLLVLMPVPYVDASASSAFRDKYRRALVGAIGIIVELWVAALALIVFIGVEPGLVRG